MKTAVREIKKYKRKCLLFSIRVHSKSFLFLLHHDIGIIGLGFLRLRVEYKCAFENQTASSKSQLTFDAEPDEITLACAVAVGG